MSKQAVFFFVALKDSRTAADLEKANKEKEKLQAQVEALKKAAHVSHLFIQSDPGVSSGGQLLFTGRQNC